MEIEIGLFFILLKCWNVNQIKEAKCCLMITDIERNNITETIYKKIINHNYIND